MLVLLILLSGRCQTSRRSHCFDGAIFFTRLPRVSFVLIHIVLLRLSHPTPYLIGCPPPSQRMRINIYLPPLLYVRLCLSARTKMSSTSEGRTHLPPKNRLTASRLMAHCVRSNNVCSTVPILEVAAIQVFRTRGLVHTM